MEAFDELAEVHGLLRMIRALIASHPEDSSLIEPDIGRALDVLAREGPDHPEYAELLEDVWRLLAWSHPAEALPLCREAVARIPDSDRELLVRRLISLGTVLCWHRHNTGEPADGEEAEAFAWAAVAAGPASEYASQGVGGLLLALKEGAQSEDASIAAVTLLRRVRAAGHEGLDEGLAYWLSAAGASKYGRYRRGSVDLGELRDASGMFDEAAGLLPLDHNGRCTCRQKQALVLRELFRVTGEATVLESVITCYREIITSPHVRPTDRAASTAWLADMLLERYRRNGDRTDLEESVARWDEAMAAPELPAATRAWAALRCREAQECRTVPRPDTAIPLDLVVISALDDPTRLEAYESLEADLIPDGLTPGGLARAGLTWADLIPDGLIPYGSPREGEAADLAALARAELLQYAHRADPAGTMPAINAARDAVLAAPVGDPNLPPLLVMLGDAYHLHTRLTEDATELPNEARIYRWAARALPSDDLRKAETFTKAANAFTDCRNTFGWPAAAADALELRHACVAATLAYDPRRQAYESMLAKAVEAASTAMLGTIPHQDEAITALRAAINTAPAGSLHRSLLLSNLSAALFDRYEDAGDRADLDESIKVLQAAADCATGKRKARLLIDLADRLRLRNSIDPSSADISAVDTAVRQAIAVDLDEVMAAGELEFDDGIWHMPAIRSRIRERARRAVVGDPRAIDLLCQLVTALGERRRRENGRVSRADLDEELHVHRQLLELIPSDSVIHLSTHRFGLALVLRRRFEWFGDPRDREEAFDIARRTYAAPGSPDIRIRAARFAGLCALREGRWAEAANDLRDAIGLLPLLAPRQIHRQDQERRLGELYGLASQAAAAALECGKKKEALEALEQGRNLLHRYATDFRIDLAKVAAVAPELARELKSVAGELDAADAVPEGAPEISADHRHRLAKRWDNAVQRVRTLTDLEDFLRMPRATDLLDGQGTIVVVNVSGRRCDALVIRDGDLDVISLDKLTVEELNSQVEVFVNTIPFAQMNPDDAEGQRLAQQPLREVLAWLWRVLAEPVLKGLDLLGPTDPGGSLPRIWWVPTGALTFLPIHASGLPGGPAVLDLAVSSYALSVQNLRTAQWVSARRSTPDSRSRLLAVAMAETPGEQPLTRTADEAAAVAKHFINPVVLNGDEATQERVLDELPAASWAHFACHAANYLDRPSESRLLLADQALTVATLARKQLPDAHLAYLSACDSARGGTRLADESITLASAFRLSGYTHAIAALWPVLDSTAAETAKVFYKEAVTGKAEPAVALHRAQLTMRSKHPDLPSRWAAYLHAGP